MMEHTQLSITADGRALECQWIGTPQPQRPVLVFLHEGLGCVQLWRDFPAKLCAASGLAGFVYSRAGYGRSQGYSLPRPLAFMAHEACVVLPELLDKAGITQAVLVGHSDGGSIALLSAAGDGQSRLSGVVTLAAHVFNEAMCVDEIRRARAAYEAGPLREKLRKYHGNNVDTAFYGWNDVWLDPGFRDWTIEDCLKDIAVPVLALQGTDDPYGSRQQLEAIAGGVKRPAEKRFIPRSRHNPHLENPSDTLKICRAFVDKTVGGRG